MKHNWEYKKLGEVFKTTSGGTPLKGNSEYYEGGDIPWLRSGEVCRKDITSCELFITQKAVDESSAKFVPSNSVVMAMYGATAAQVGILRKSMTTNQAICSIFPKEGYNSDFLYYYLLNQKCSLLNRAYGAAQPNISQTIIKSIPIPIIPIGVQERIVAELDKLNEMIATRKEQLKELDNLAQSLFYDTFGDPVSNPKGWEVKKLGDVIEGKLEYGAGASGIPYNGNIRYIRITDINENGHLKEEIAVSPSVYESKYDLDDGDVLFARSGATVGKTFLYTSKIGKAIYAGYLIRATPRKHLLLPQYLYSFTKTAYYWDFIAHSVNGVAQPNVNAKSYSLLPVPIPPLPLQQKFTTQVEAIERQKEIVEASIAELQTLLDSRMDYWFN